MSEPLILGPDTIVSRLNRAVICGGGELLGIQESIAGPWLCLFANPDNGTALTLSFDHNTLCDSDFSTLVHKKIEESSANFADRKISVKASVLTRVARTLADLSKEIEDTYLQKK